MLHKHRPDFLFEEFDALAVRFIRRPGVHNAGAASTAGDCQEPNQCSSWTGKTHHDSARRGTVGLQAG
jgi:hypothetical protein